MALAYGFDMAHTLKHDTETILNTGIPLSTVEDSQSLYDVFTKATCATEKILLIDFQALKEAYTSFEVSDSTLVKSEFNIAVTHTMPKTT